MCAAWDAILTADEREAVMIQVPGKSHPLDRANRIPKRHPMWQFLHGFLISEFIVCSLFSVKWILNINDSSFSSQAAISVLSSGPTGHRFLMVSLWLLSQAWEWCTNISRYVITVLTCTSQILYPSNNMRKLSFWTQTMINSTISLHK